MKNEYPNPRRGRKPFAQRSGGKPSANNPGRTVTGQKAKRRSASKSKERILLVDDEPDSLELFSALLSEAGYQVDQADNALAAICAVVRHAPDLVLADIRMPIVDGRELVREFKNHSDTRHIPVIALTGYNTPEMRESAHKAGYDDFIAKPIDPRRFPNQIAKLLRQHKLKPASKAA